MVLQKRLDYGFNGYQVPPTPRAARSARRRCSFRKKVDDNQMCAFDLLATIAGKILLEGEGSPSTCDILTGNELCPTAKDSIKKEQQVEDNLLKVENCDQGSCDRSFFISELVSQVPVLEHCSKEFSHARDDGCCRLPSVITPSDCSEKVGSAEKLVHDKCKILLGSFSSKVEVSSSGYQESCDCTLEENKKQIKIEMTKTGNLSNSTKADICSIDDPAVRDRKPPALVSVGNSMTLPLCTNHVSRGSLPASRDDVKLVIRDDDENCSVCTQPSTTTMPFRLRPCIGDRRIRKRLTSKYWKVTPKLKHDEHFNASSETKPVYHNRKICYKSQRSQRDYPFKKRKLYDHSSVSNYDRGTSSKGMTTFLGKGFSCDAPGSGATVNGARIAGHYTKFQSKDSHASGTSARVAGHYTKFQSKDSHVKLRIKSFRVPELFIEIPESATVGSLKRRVMEAVTTILGGGLRVGVLLQGKKIRDDEKTLLQTGICHDNKLDALGFSLEPSPSQAPPPLCHEDCPVLLTCGTPQPLTRYPPAPVVVHNVVQQRTADPLTDLPLANLGNFVENDHDSAPSPPEIPVDKSPVDSRALVAVPAMNVEALALVPLRKSKQSEAAQRRIRRPFSVSEVEALVQAVEKLGTGRWRDVKLRAFDNAKHRTYVDLKDKWKTLVHTARISPQQRRGEPVPQELLDRVLTAHSYWSQQLSKPET
ncbi:telomere repeat-binding protein 5-like isoform X2 [Actinidia eriantha]|uniref:telomere repeat-binding protein 5-like isoform X2 n=1 Tax=Actinidia eriantha TaxID=165200 RepID=UPI00258C9233|nr:telomere repeat-binding protein 5-like isoform X2 [Actinidia eriantha]